MIFMVVCKAPFNHINTEKQETFMYITKKQHLND